MAELVIATHNRGKLAELEQLLSPLGYRLTCAADHHLPEPEETEPTFTGNALLKASHCARATGLPSLADDSGLCVEALDGAPGVHSARWAGPQRDFSLAIEKLRATLIRQSVGPEGARASFLCCLALVTPGEPPLTVTGSVHGSLTFPPRGQHGFGYDPIFIPEGHSQTFGEMPSPQKHAISHRTRAFNALVAALTPA